MTVLIAVMGEGKGTWGHVYKIIEDLEWENIIVVTQEFFRPTIRINKKHELVLIDSNKPLPELVEDISKALDGKVFGDAAVNLISGNGKEHMALLASLLKVGAGVRLIALTKDGVKEI